MYYRAWSYNVQQGGIDFMGKYMTYEEASIHGDFCDYIDEYGIHHTVLDSGRIIW